MLSIRSFASGSRFETVSQVAYPYRMGWVVATRQYVPVDASSTTVEHRVGYLDQLTSGSHYNDVAHLDFSGALTNVRFSDESSLSDVNKLTGSKTYFTRVANSQWLGGMYYVSTLGLWSVDAQYATPSLGTIMRSGKRRACWAELHLSTDNASWVRTWSIHGRFYQAELDNSTRGWYREFDIPDLSSTDWTWREQLSGYVSVPAYATRRAEEIISLYRSKWLAQDADFFASGWYTFTFSPRVLSASSFSWTPPVIWPGHEDAIFPVKDRNPPWGDLARQAYQDLGFFSGNGIALLNDVIHMKEAADSTLRTIKSLGARKVAAVSQLFLSFHYGWSLLASDLQELYHSLQSNASLKRCQAAYSWTTDSADYIARYICDFDPWQQVRDILDLFVGTFDLELRPHIAWDMIPFSFVVDWFVNIGELLTGLDNFYTLTQRHRVVASSRSIICRKKVSSLLLGLPAYLSGEVIATFYKRQYGHPISPSLFPSVTQQSLWNHSVEGFALVTSIK